MFNIFNYRARTVFIQRYYLLYFLNTHAFTEPLKPLLKYPLPLKESIKQLLLVQYELEKLVTRCSVDEDVIKEIGEYNV